MELEEALATIKTMEESIKKLEAKNVEIISEKRQEQTKREEIEKEKAKAEEAIAKEKGDFEKLLEIEKQKNAEKISDLETKSANQFKQLEKQLLTSEVSKLARALGGNEDNAEMLTPHIDRRLQLVDKDGTLELVVLDATGNATDKSVSELEEEFRSTAKYANNIQGRKATGGGAGNEGDGGAGDADDWEKYFQRDASGSRVDIDKMYELKALDEKKYEELLKKYA